MIEDGVFSRGSETIVIFQCPCPSASSTESFCRHPTSVALLCCPAGFRYAAPSSPCFLPITRRYCHSVTLLTLHDDPHLCALSLLSSCVFEAVASPTGVSLFLLMILNYRQCVTLSFRYLPLLVSNLGTAPLPPISLQSLSLLCRPINLSP